MAGWSEQDLELGDVKLRFLRGGSGRPVLVLHHDIGTLDDLPFYDALAGKFDVIVPRHPGFGVEERPSWMRHPRDIAALYQWLLADLGIERASLVGLGFGGWVAGGVAGLAARRVCGRRVGGGGGGGGGAPRPPPPPRAWGGGGGGPPPPEKKNWGTGILP